MTTVELGQGYVVQADTEEFLLGPVDDSGLWFMPLHEEKAYFETVEEFAYRLSQRRYVNVRNPTCETCGERLGEDELRVSRAYFGSGRYYCENHIDEELD